MTFKAVSTIPIPKKVPGLCYGSAAAPVTINVFLDPLCPDCTTGWKTMESVIKKYGDKICVHALFLSLPFHTWSFTIQRTVTAVAAIDVEKAKLCYSDLFVNSQAKLNSAALAGKSEEQALEAIIQWAAKVSGIPEAQIKEKYQDSNVFLNARIEFKYACQNAVNSTPTFFINGAKTAIDDSATLENWSSVLDPLLA